MVMKAMGTIYLWTSQARCVKLLEVDGELGTEKEEGW